jgi:glycosyltransferase involved in cell wall biosynthesis
VREDVRGILIHAREIARTIIYGSDRPRQARTLAAFPAPDWSEVQAHPPYSPALRDEILPTLRMVVHPRPGDVLWTAGLYRNFIPLRIIGEMRVKTGLRVVTTCYDLFRVTHPQFNPPGMPAELFVADTIALLDASDLVLAISESTQRELLSFARRGGRNPPTVRVIRLGSDIRVGRARAEIGVGPALPEVLTGRRFALAVGTVEPRKNYELLLRVWQQLVADPSFVLDLVIVGRRGFGAEDTALAIESSPLIGSRILWLENCPDDVLALLYDKCHILLYPSFGEGWGLPVTEALSFGREVITSNRDGIIEAGLGRAQLLDPEDDQSWAAAIAKAAAKPRIRGTLSDLPSWDETAAAVEQQLRQIATMQKVA